MVTRRRTPQLAATQPADDMRSRFVDAYMLRPNATQAAITAGYSPRTAYAQGSALLKVPEVAREIARRTKEAEDRAAKRYDISHDRIRRGLAEIGFSNIADFVLIDGKGNATLDLQGATREQLAAVSSIDFQKGRIRMMDRRAALVDLGKATGLFSDGPDISIPVTFIVERSAKKRDAA